MAGESNQPSERRAAQSGIRSGGRRKSDHQLVEAGNKGRWLIAISFGLSACILAWAFSLPFRGHEAMVSFGDSQSHRNTIDVNPASRVVRGTSANDQYVQSMLHLERKLKLELASKSESPKHLPGKAEAQAVWRKRLENHVKNAKVLTEASGGEIKQGTIEWQAQQDLQKLLQDAPEQ